ncbi:MAG: DUF4864 domain-containing protein [Silicimonas sp.]|jgi:hypothetical protein|nr:DUF4864 domain-containing protein [Silicimonas sp.]
MRFGRLFLATIIGVLWIGSASADEVLAPEPGIEATIGAQIEAFLVDDFAQAFTYASPGIQGIFGNSDRFGQMVRQGYPMVWRPGDVEYLDLREVAGALWQRVMIRDRAGTTHVLDYQMIETSEGWKINGVELLRLPGVAA